MKYKGEKKRTNCENDDQFEEKVRNKKRKSDLTTQNVARDTIGVAREPQKVPLIHHNLNLIGPKKVNLNEHYDQLEESVQNLEKKSD